MTGLSKLQSKLPKYPFGQKKLEEKLLSAISGHRTKKFWPFVETAFSGL